MLATLRANIAATLLGLLAAVLLIVSAVLYVQLHGFLWIKGANDRLEDCARDRNELRAITTAKNEQKAETGKRIEQAEKSEREGRKIADQIREAPIPPNCETPGLEIMRNEL